MTNSNNKPTHEIFHIRSRGDDKKAEWTKVGVAFKNKDDSLNLIVNLLPVDGKLQVREIKEKTE